MTVEEDDLGPLRCSECAVLPRNGAAQSGLPRRRRSRAGCQTVRPALARSTLAGSAVVEHPFVVWFGVGEGEAGGFGAVAAGVVVGVDAAEERLDIAGGGVGEDGSKGGAAR